MSLLGRLITLVELGYVPDSLVRAGIRALCRQRLHQVSRTGTATDVLGRFAALMREGPVAPVPEKANEQHYELPAEFFEQVLGRNLKYSAGLWAQGVSGLDEAEDAALDATVQRAGIDDGMQILELGCGWGSLTLWMAERFPTSRITAVSNSASQRAHITARAAERGYTNLRVITADMNHFDTEQRFDRIVSVEMFEHMRNYQELMRRIAGWLKPDGRLFVHIFCHRRLAYEFETRGASDWMGRYFFTGGIMPSLDVFSQFGDDLLVDRQWSWDGTHYQRTANAWLDNMDAHRKTLMPIFEQVYGRDDATRWFNRWRVFFMACAELFGYRRGTEWLVGHYLLRHATQESCGITPQVEEDPCRGAA